MFTNVLFGLGILVAAVSPPNTDGMPLINQGFGQCPDESVIEFRDFDSNPQNPNALIRIFYGPDGPFAALVLPDKQIYLYDEQRYVSIEELQLKYPTPCDIPHKTKI